MDKTKYLKNWMLEEHSRILKNVSVDNVIFGYHEKELKVLMQRPQGIPKWGLPGGYIKKDETISQAAERVAKERTGLDNLFLKQFKAFGNPGRNQDPDFTPHLLSKISGFEIKEDHWMFDFYVSVGFYTLTEFSKVNPNGEFYMEECMWWDIQNLPKLLFDHEEIINEALKAIRLHLYHYPIGLKLLQEKFTLPEIHSLYETILGKKIDDRNFSKKLLATGLIIKLNEKKKIGPHRSPFLYKFNKEVYNKALKEGMVLVL